MKNGITATLIKRERVKGEPKPPKEPADEVIQLSVKGDVPGPDGKRKAHVRMIWESGARKALVGTVYGSLFVEEKGTNEDKITAWLGFAIIKTDVNGPMARGASRYCMKDAGPLRRDAPLAYRLEEAAGRQGIALALRRTATSCRRSAAATAS